MIRVNQTGISILRECPKKYKLTAIDLWEPLRESKALYIGKLWHMVLKIHKTRGMEAVREFLVSVGDPFLREEILAIFLAWYERGDIPCVKTEMEFEVPVYDAKPEIKYFVYGTVDGIAIQDGAAWIVEHKLVSDINFTWLSKLSVDTQLLIYRQFALDGTPEIHGAIYDMVKKPTIRPKKNESPEAFSVRVVEWYKENEQTAFFREKILFGETDIAEQVEMTYREIRWRTENQYWPRNPNACFGHYRQCRFFPYCESGDNENVLRNYFTKRSIPHATGQKNEADI